MDPVVVANTVNLTSPIGWALAKAAGCTISRRGRYWQATGYRWAWPRVGACTVGSVVISRGRLPEGVWAHETVHVKQYALLGPALWPAYVIAAAWSAAMTGDWWSRNSFERRAGLSAGGYREAGRRSFNFGSRARNAGTAAGAAVA